MSNELRALLIDCRIALRRAGGNDATTLGARLEQAIRDIDRGALSTGSSVTDTIGNSQQVALAWQTTCRGLMLSHPQLYGELRDRVMSLLDQRELRDPDAELLQAEQRLREAQAEQQRLLARIDGIGERAATAQAALNMLREALAQAVEGDVVVADDDDPQVLALARIDWLRTQCRGSASTSATGGSAPADSPIPTRSVLRAVAAGERALSAEQRDWVVGEALGVTGWQYTPLELLAKGEAWLAQQLLDSASVLPD